MKKPPTEIGVIVGRFQVHQLHDAHIELIETVAKKHKKALLFLGVSPVLLTKRNPLDFLSRRAMINEEFPGLVIIPISDDHSDAIWSDRLDRLIREVCPMGEVTLYGGRDSFIPHYQGSFQTEELEPTVFISGTEVRQEIQDSVSRTSEFRHGVIYASANKFPVSFQTVDIAVLDKGRVLMCRKPGETLLRFPGGFVDPADESLEMAAKREAQEELSLDLEDLKYLGSVRINDWRYKSESDKIMTAFFSAKYTWGTPQPGDDISECMWVNIKKTKITNIAPAHVPLWKLLT